MRAELQVLKKQVEVFWKGVSFSSAQALHSPHTKELDELLEKFQRDEIQSEKDLEKLKSMLQDVVNHDSSPMRKKFALDILTLIHVRFEIGGDLVTAMRKETDVVR
jgi:negative regulator of genetic competence, sporulation and motility